VRCIGCDGEPGSSAQREYDRLKAREASARVTLGKNLGGIQMAIRTESQATRAWADGAIGERKLAAVLRSVSGVRTLSDRRAPGRANLDFIVVGPSGVFVVDAKYYRGVITFRDDGTSSVPDYRLYVNEHDRSPLADEMQWQVDTVRHALATSFRPTPPVTPVLCFVDGTWSIPLPPVHFRGVRLVSEKSIKGLIADEKLLDATLVNQIHRAMTLAFPPR